MTSALAVAIAVLAVLVGLASVLVVQRWRLARRFARRLSPYARPRTPGIPVDDPEEWVGD
jgi:uncharacterized protein YjeT (DUF2065 family)